MDSQYAVADSPGTAGDVTQQVGVLANVFHARVRELLDPLGVTLTQLTLLSHLQGHPTGQTITELCAAVDVQQPGVSKAVTKLEALGEVDVERSEELRARRVRLNPDGHERLAQIRLELAAEVDVWFQGWSDADISTMLAATTRLSSAIDARRGQRNRSQLRSAD